MKSLWPLISGSLRIDHITFFTNIRSISSTSFIWMTSPRWIYWPRIPWGFRACEISGQDLESMTHCTGLKGKASLSAPFGGSISLGSPVSPHRDVLSISEHFPAQKQRHPNRLYKQQRVVQPMRPNRNRCWKSNESGGHEARVFCIIGGLLSECVHAQAGATESNFRRMVQHPNLTGSD